MSSVSLRRPDEQEGWRNTAILGPREREENVLPKATLPLKSGKRKFSEDKEIVTEKGLELQEGTEHRTGKTGSKPLDDP